MRRDWTSTELDTLRKHAHEGATVCAMLLDRTTASVRRQAQAMRISLRRSGSKAGRLLGQPAGVSLTELRQAAANPARAEEILTALRNGEIPTVIITQAQAIGHNQLPLCPGCTRNHIDHKPSGLCRACYLRGLAAAHQAHTDATQAQRDLWQARQAAKRAKDKPA